MNGIPYQAPLKPNYGLAGYFPQGSTGEGAPASRYVVAGMVNATATTTSTAATGVWRAISHFFPMEVTILDVSLSFTVAGGVGSVVNVGIYSNKDRHIPIPDKLLWSSDNYDGNSATKQTKNCGLILQRGLYWFAYNVGTASPTFRMLAAAGQSIIPIVDTTFNNTTTNMPTHYSYSLAYGAMPYRPATITTLGLNSVFPMIGLHIQ